MRRLLLAMALVLALISLINCGGTYDDWDVQFVAYNNSRTQVSVVVNGGEARPIAANSSITFTQKVDVPKAQNRSFTSPSATVNDTTQVSIVFRDSTGAQTTPEFCQAGAKVAVTVTYEVSGGRAWAQCRSTY